MVQNQILGKVGLLLIIYTTVIFYITSKYTNSQPLTNEPSVVSFDNFNNNTKKIPKSVSDEGTTHMCTFDDLAGANWTPPFIEYDKSIIFSYAEPTIVDRYYINPTCDWNHYTKQQICEILKGKSVIFVGDSIMRRLYETVIQELAGFEYLWKEQNEEFCESRKNQNGYGSRWWHSNKTGKCTSLDWDKQYFGDIDCPIEKIAYFMWPNNVFVSHSPHRFWERLQDIIEPLSVPFVIVNQGFHVLEDTKLDIYYAHIAKLKYTYGKMIEEKNGELIWSSISGRSHEKQPPQWANKVLQKNNHTYSMNLKAKEVCDSIGMSYFDTFWMTANQPRYTNDGTHHSKGMERMKWWILLDHIRLKQKTKKEVII